MRILLADDHAMVRSGLRQLLEQTPGWTVCGEAATGPEAVSQARQLAPDLVVMDLTLPELSGVEATRLIRAAQPDTEVLILTMHESEQLACAALSAGARGYVLKSDSRAVLATAIERVTAHRFFVTPRLPAAHAGLRSGDGAMAGAATHTLTARQEEVLRRLAEGQSPRAVAEALGVSVSAVEAHRARILRRLGLGSSSELVRYAIRNGLIEP